MMKLAVLSGVAVLGLTIALALFANLLKRNSLFFPSRYPAGNWDPSLLPLAPRDVTFRTPDGTRLHGWYFEAADAHAPTLIWFHGNGNNLSERGIYGATFAQRGLNVLLFDYRGYGKSEGAPTEEDLYEDSFAAYDFAAGELSRPPASIVLYGESLGGPYAARVATRRRARCVIIENSFPSLQSVGRVLFPRLPLHWFVRNSLTTARWLNEAGLPVMILHGKCDTTLPFTLAMELYDSLRVPKRLFISETANHCQIQAIEGERYYREVISFVRQPPVPTVSVSTEPEIETPSAALR